MMVMMMTVVIEEQAIFEAVTAVWGGIINE
jgi:hypothetical protein